MTIALSGCTGAHRVQPIQSSEPAQVQQTTVPATPAGGRPCTESDLPSPGPASVPAPVRLATVETFPTATVTLSPPAPDDIATASPQQAWDNAMIDRRSDARYELVLARMATQFPATMGQGTSTAPLYTGVLVWAVVARGVPIAPAGGPPLPAGVVTRPGPVCYWTDELDLTDATTGQRMFSATFGSGQ